MKAKAGVKVDEAPAADLSKVADIVFARFLVVIDGGIEVEETSVEPWETRNENTYAVEAKKEGVMVQEQERTSVSRGSCSARWIEKRCICATPGRGTSLL